VITDIGIGSCPCHGPHTLKVWIDIFNEDSVKKGEMEIPIPNRHVHKGGWYDRAGDMLEEFIDAVGLLGKKSISNVDMLGRELLIENEGEIIYPFVKD